MFAGIQRVPSADGFYLQWNTSTSTGEHYTQVDETPCNGITDYNFSTTTGSRDSYVVSLPRIMGTSTITEITVYPCASKHIATTTTSEMNVFYRFSGVNSSDAGSYVFSGTSTVPVELATTTFSGLNLVQTSTSTLEIGAVLSNGSEAGVRLSRIAVELVY